MFESKYVIIAMDSFTVPFVFGEFIGHDEMAERFPGKVIGAGFCRINAEGQYSCYGESKSLRIKADPECDARFLNRYLGVVDE